MCTAAGADRPLPAAYECGSVRRSFCGMNEWPWVLGGSCYCTAAKLAARVGGVAVCVGAGYADVYRDRSEAPPPSEVWCRKESETFPETAERC